MLGLVNSPSQPLLSNTSAIHAALGSPHYPLSDQEFQVCFLVGSVLRLFMQGWQRMEAELQHPLFAKGILFFKGFKL